MSYSNPNYQTAPIDSMIQHNARNVLEFTPTTNKRSVDDIGLGPITNNTSYDTKKRNTYV